MSERSIDRLRGFEVKHRPMAEAAAIADAIVRRYGKRAVGKPSSLEDPSSLGEKHEPRESAL